jgi:hypothetical protein
MIGTVVMLVAGVLLTALGGLCVFSAAVPGPFGHNRSGGGPWTFRPQPQRRRAVALGVALMVAGLALVFAAGAN